MIVIKKITEFTYLQKISLKNYALVIVTNDASYRYDNELFVLWSVSIKCVNSYLIRTSSENEKSGSLLDNMNTFLKNCIQNRGELSRNIYHDGYKINPYIFLIITYSTKTGGWGNERGNDIVSEIRQYLIMKDHKFFISIATS